MSYPLTIFTTCKPFLGETASFQTLAIQSWRNLGLNVIIMGEEEGAREVANKYNCIYVPKVESSSDGIPFVNSLFDNAFTHSNSEYLCYLNADIVLNESFLTAIKLFVKHDFNEQHKFMTARRKTVPYIKFSAQFSVAIKQLEKLSKDYGIWDAPNAIDMFLYNRCLFDKIPAFEIGRTHWDNWLISYANKKNAAIVDASQTFHLLHPFHGYAKGLNESLLGLSNQKNKQISQGNIKDLHNARNYIISNNIILPCKESSTTSIDKNFEFNQTNELKTFLFYLDNSIDTRTNSELWEDVRRFLWRAKKYFPFNEPVSDMQLLRQQFKNNQLNLNETTSEEIYLLLQDSVSSELSSLLQTIQSNSTPISVWGTGGYSERLREWLTYKNITISYYIDSSPKAESHQDKRLFNPEQLASESSKSFIIIGSIYINDIKAKLLELGFNHKLDFTF